MLSAVLPYLFFSILGFCSGSILYAYYLPLFFCGKNLYKDTSDGNPGTANAFLQGGVFCGILCLLLELAKGFLPIFTALHGFFHVSCDIHSPLSALVLSAPVLGHAMPFFRPAKGGKCIAVSFGVLLGLFPHWQPVVILAFFYLFFSLILVIRPHLFRSVTTFFLTSLCIWLFSPFLSVRIGCILISCTVIVQHLKKHNGEKPKLPLFL